MDGIQEVLDFWFDEDTKAHWFQPDAAFDQGIRKRFAELFARAATGELASWEDSPEGCLALCILLDQMPRNMFRGNARAFANDAKALAVAERAVTRGFDQRLTMEQKQFLYMPFMHSEDLANQLRALALFEAQGLRDGARYAEEHLAIIRRFGRFPHRNPILGRESTEDELEFLGQGGGTYGQTSAGTVGEAPSDEPRSAGEAPSEEPESAPEAIGER